MLTTGRWEGTNMRASLRTPRCFPSSVIFREAAQSDSKLFPLKAMGGPGL